MKALIMKGIGQVEMVERPIPEPGPLDVIIKTTVALICTSDVHTVSGSMGDFSGRALGHEAVGVIHKLGDLVRGFKVGDRVAVNAITPCWQCHNCQRGFSSQCTQPLGGYRFTAQKDGNLAEYFHVNDAQGNLAPIPDDVSDEAAAYATDMMSTGFKGAENADIPVGGTVAVFGLGPVGLMAVAAARLLAASRIFAVDCVPHRFQLAKEYGADVTVNFKELDPVAEIMRQTGGVGVDSAMEALGSQTTFENCIKVTRPGGTISNIGYHGHGDYINIPRLDWGLGMAEKTIRTLLCPAGSERMARLMSLIQAGRVDPTKLSSHHFKFADAEKGLRLMTTKEDNVIKPVIHFG
ncbi:NAD(P)-dependent alcohol dehydrogenase [candidate division KSB1 bacterium]|nr:NAD(P)-dependent alcohol dehydrogenase [candidate division KSB1 bacterium]